MKKRTKALMTVLVSLLVLGILATAGLFYAREYILFWNGRPLFLQAKHLELQGSALPEAAFFEQFPNLRSLDARGSGMTVQDYTALRSHYPQLEIRWDVPFQGGYLDSHTETLELTSLEEESVRHLKFLKRLTSVIAWDCEDYAALTLLQSTMPVCKVFYSVNLGKQEFDCDIRDMVLVNANGEELLEKLAYLPKVEKLYLTGQLPSGDTLEKLQKEYPDVKTEWEIVEFGQVFGKYIQELTVPGDQIREVEELEELLPYVPDLQKVDLLECDLDQEKLVDLANQYPDIDFLFNLQIGHVMLTTDAAEIDISNHKFESTREVERYVNCFPNIQKVVMCECGIANEDMDDLNRKYENIRFVWSVQIGVKLFRTDSTYYAPNSWGEKCFDETIYNLRYCTDMICVDIGHMDKVTNCEWAAFMPNLKYLILAQTGIRDLTPLSGLKNLVFLELFQSSVKDYSPLLSVTSLEDLNLSYTYGDPAPIYEMTWLKRLWWTGCWWEARNELPKVNPGTEMEFFEVSSTGGTWREGQHYYDMRDLIGMGYMTG